jgi:methyl-accepting chemotaxis protein
MNIRTKLIFGFGLIVVFIAVQTGITYLYLGKSEALVKRALNKDFDNTAAISHMAILGQQLRRYEKEYFIYANNPQKRKKYQEEWMEAFRELGNLLTQAREDSTDQWSQSDKLEFDKWQSSLEEYHSGFALITENVERGLIKGTLEANEQIQDAKNRFKVLLDGTSAYGDRKLKEAHETEKEINSNFTLINNIVLLTSASGILLALVLMVIIPGTISRPIRILTNSAHTMSTGDLDQPVPLTTGAEFRDLAETLERMRVSQKTLMDRFRSNRS